MARLTLSVFALAALCGTAPADDFPAPPDTQATVTKALPPAEAAARFAVPAGFRVSVFAAEPDVRNPIALNWDARGRLWVAENYTYAEVPKRFDMALRDRVLIFEDADGDGKFDGRKVFTDDVQGLGGVEIGLGGAWLVCPPRLLFVPDRDGDDVPDGPAEVVLDGFNVAGENHHTFANGLRWGPDGWLYGRCGASSPGQIGVPGTPEAGRVPLRGGIWRFHPASKRFETLAHGTTNPWGHDWDALGELFFINTVNGHLWHMIPGSHLVRPHTIEPNPRAYALIDQHADHWHWDNARDLKYGPTDSPEDDRRGGGHAHSGMMIYGADQWPETYRGKLFTLNLHGRRVNVERLEREGSGFVGRHEPDMLQSADPWFRGIDLTYGPDGGVYVLDWSDTGECHEHDGVHRNSGRIFKVTHGAPKPAAPFDLGVLDGEHLVMLNWHANEWYARQARRVLVDRAARGERLETARAKLREELADERDPVFKLRALWALNALGGADDALLRPLLRDGNEAVRAWAVRLLTDAWPIDTIFSARVGPDVEPPADLLAELVGLGRDDPSGLVRLVLGSTLQRLPVGRRLGLAAALASHDGDASDHNLPALVWTALIPVAAADPVGLVGLAAGSRFPLLVRLTARRLGEDVDANPGPVNALLGAANGRPQEFRGLVLAGLADALKGRRKARRPEGWGAFREGLTADKNLARDLDVVFGDGRALDEVRAVALDDHAEIEARKAALRSLIEARPADLRAVCEGLLRVRFLNAVAVRGLALFDDPALGRTIAASYRAFHPSERPGVLEALVSRPEFAPALLDRVAAGGIPRADLTPFHARQIRSIGDPALDRRLAEVWGELRESPADRKERAGRLKAVVQGGKGEAGRGRLVFDKVCGSCHKLYGRGGDLGPDLTGAGRDNLDYLLENLTDPGASVSADYRMTVVAMKDGRVLNGLARAATEKTLALQTPTGLLNLDRDDVEQATGSNQSLMPEGLADGLDPGEFRDLIAYLTARTQVPAAPSP